LGSDYRWQSGRMRQGNGVWANVTNFKDGETTRIKGSMNLMHGKKSVADIIDISERCYVFTVLWSIFYNEPKPLKFARGKGRPSDNVQVVDGRTYFGAPPMRDYVHPGTKRLGPTRHTQYGSRSIRFWRKSSRVPVVSEGTCVLPRMTSRSTAHARSSLDKLHVISVLCA